MAQDRGASRTGQCRRRAACDSRRPPGPRRHRVRAGKIRDPTVDGERPTRSRRSRSSSPSNATLVHERDAPEGACTVVIDLELQLDDPVAGLQLQLRGRVGATASRDLDLGAPVTILREGGAGGDERSTECNERRSKASVDDDTHGATAGRKAGHAVSVRATAPCRNGTLVPVSIRGH